MTAMAARSLGYRIHVMDPDPSCPARFVVDACFEGDWDDARAAADLARGSDVVTLEIEQVSLACLEAAAQYAPVRPGRALLQIIQDRILQKDWLRDHGFPVGRYRAHSDSRRICGSALWLWRPLLRQDARAADMTAAARRRSASADASALSTKKPDAWLALGSAPCVAEQALDLEKEISVMVARSPSGEVKSFPSARQSPRKSDPCLERDSFVDSRRPGSSARRASPCDIGRRIELEGLLAVEMFLTKDGIAAGQRTGAAPAQQLSRQRARLRHQPV